MTLVARISISTPAPQNPAATSSSTIPQPPLSERSHHLAGQGLNWSKMRNNTTPARHPATVGGAASQVTSTPATSSMQTICGSFVCRRRATTLDAQIPTQVTTVAVRNSALGPHSIRIQKRGIAPSVPAVPGAFGTRPQPNHNANTRATRSPEDHLCR